MRVQEHITALFVGGLYYCLMGDEDTADVCWRTAVDFLENFPVDCIVGEA